MAPTQSSHPITAPIPQNQSKTAFPVPFDKSDAIIRTCAYHYQDYDRAVIWFTPTTHSNSIVSVLPDLRDPTTSLGELDRLPLEIINQICLDLDIASIICFRQINLRARQVVNELHEYKIITTHALNPFCALLRTQTASRARLIDFYNLLCTQMCSVCNVRYGDLVYLPTWIRCCSHCLQSNDPKVAVATLARVQRFFRLSKGSIAKLPWLKTIPGQYTMEEKMYSRRIVVVPILSAWSAFNNRHVDIPTPLDMMIHLNAKEIDCFKACCALPSYNTQTRQIETGVSCSGCQSALEDCLSTAINWDSNWAYNAREMVYSNSGFLEHFSWCRKAQDLWLESNDGKVEPPGLPNFCKKGGFCLSRV